MSEKCLLDQWRDMAYDRNLPKDQLEKFWGTYFTIEREIYEQLLENPDEEVKGTVKELAEKYGQDVMTMVGFLDGINDSLKTANPIETMEEDTVVSLAFDKELLYKNMIDAKADWLYELPQWKEIFSEEEYEVMSADRKELIKEISHRVSAIKVLVRDMTEARKVANHKENFKEKAFAYEETVRPYLESIRDHIDHLEMEIDDEIWPLPKYRELLFTK